jgi:hypothetical protein
VLGDLGDHGDSAPALDATAVVRHYGTQAVAWPSNGSPPSLLDPVTTIVAQLLDGSATLDDITGDVHSVLGISMSIARAQLSRSVQVLETAGLLASSSRVVHAPDSAGDLFSAPASPSLEAVGRRGEATPINLEIGRSRVRVTCTHPVGAEILRRGLSDFVIADDAPLGFVIHATTPTRRLFVLNDRSGFVLARSRTIEECVAALAMHLGALVEPPPGLVRLKGRMVMSDVGRAAVGLFPVFAAPPLVERRLSAGGLRLVDRLVLDFAPRSLELHTPTLPWHLVASDPGPGHAAGTASDGARLSMLVLPCDGVASTPSIAEVILTIAVAAGGTDRDAVLDMAERIVATADVRVLPYDDRSARYAALQSLR